MKKVLLLIASVAIAAQGLTAQTTVENSKTFWDNWYIGINGGGAVKTTHTRIFKNIDPQAGLRIGRWITPVFGFAVEGNARFGDRPHYEGIKCNGTFVSASEVNVFGTTNFSNWFGGYNGEPRVFELIGVYGIGWQHFYGTESAREQFNYKNAMTNRLALDFTFNLGQNKAWQLYIEPGIEFMLTPSGHNNPSYNINKSALQCLVGLNYKFGNSNGTHNFKTARLYDQAEVDGLNNKVNELDSKVNNLNSTVNNLNNQNKAKDRTIDSLRNVNNQLQNDLDKCNRTPKTVSTTTTNLQPTVLLKQGKSTITTDQYAPISLIANYMKNHKDAKVEIRGYASPEGNPELNQRLSQNRANAVKNALVNKYGISADRLSAVGMGATDKLFEEVEFNRVATFNDNKK